MIPLTIQAKSATIVDATALPERDRFDFWDSVIQNHFCPASNKPNAHRNDFKARIQMRNLGCLSLSKLGTTGMTSDRSNMNVRRQPLDSFFVSQLSAGSACIEQGGRRGIQRVGDFIMYDSARPFFNDMPAEYSGYWLRVPRQVMLNRLPHAETMTARPIAGTSTIGRMLILMLNEAIGLDLASDTPASQRVAMSLVDLLAAAFETGSGLQPTDNPRHAALLDKAKSWILANLEDPELDCDSLATSIGVSRRTLNRIFAPEDTTPIRWMWRQRLNRAHELLTTGGESRVSDVALKCGFSDFSHFARAFRSTFGVMPKSLLSKPH